MYVWIDAVLGYTTATMKYCEEHNLNWKDYWQNNDNALNILKTIYKQEKEKNKDLTFEFLDDFMEYLRIQDESLKLRRK